MLHQAARFHFAQHCGHSGISQVPLNAYGLVYDRDGSLSTLPQFFHDPQLQIAKPMESRF